MSLDQRGLGIGRIEVPTAAEAVRSALGSVRAEGLEPDAAGMALLDAVAAEELGIDEAIERALSLYKA